MNKEQIYIRVLKVEDWEIFRDIRLYALKTCPEVYSGAYEVALKRTDQEWKDLLSDDDKCIFGLFCEEKIIGITGIFTCQTNSVNAVLVMTFIHENYRGRGLSALIYKARMDFAVQRRNWRKITVSHREGNEPSRRAMLRHGFQYIGKEKGVWPDGSEDWDHMYELDLGVLRTV